MKVTLLRNSPLGRMGQVRDIDTSSVRAAFALGLAEQYMEPDETEKPKRIYRKKEEDAPKPKRTYKRKDMQAEAPVEIASPMPEPDPQPEPEPEGENEEMDGTDEAAVRL
jgi:hypothetical protein